MNLSLVSSNSSFLSFFLPQCLPILHLPWSSFLFPLLLQAPWSSCLLLSPPSCCFSSLLCFCFFNHLLLHFVFVCSSIFTSSTFSFVTSTTFGSFYEFFPSRQLYCLLQFSLTHSFHTLHPINSMNFFSRSYSKNTIKCHFINTVIHCNMSTISVRGNLIKSTFPFVSDFQNLSPFQNHFQKSSVILWTSTLLSF